MYLSEIVFIEKSNKLERGYFLVIYIFFKIFKIFWEKKEENKRGVKDSNFRRI